MKTKKVTKRIGEYLGPIDWDYDFLHHFDTYSGFRTKEEMCEEYKERLRKLEKNPRQYQVNDYDGIFGWRNVVRVGMYDGWPYWEPHPAVEVMGDLTTTWLTFNQIKYIRKKE